ncbi:MAG: periplasmic heavy metal sensor [Candidatus Binatia bacterium]
MEDPTRPLTSSNSAQPRRRRGFVTGLLLGIVGAGLVGFAVGATMPTAEAALGALAHGGFRSSHDGPPTPEEAKEKAEFFVGFALHRLDATDEQEENVQKIVDRAIDEIFPVIHEHRANRDEFRSILAGPAIDRAAIEKLRAEEMALAESLSRTLASALADTAEALTTEQRTALVERLERFHHRH